MQYVLRNAGIKAVRSGRQQWVWWRAGRFHVTSGFRPASGRLLLARVFGLNEMVVHNELIVADEPVATAAPAPARGPSSSPCRAA